MSYTESENRLKALEQDAERTALRLATAERRLRVTWSLAGTALVVAIVLGGNKESLAQGYGVTLAQLLSRVVSLETKTASMSAITDEVTGKPTVRFDGVNLQVVSGSGDTQGAVNGLGNLIVGYNESNGFLNRTGSHNLIVGEGNNYSSFGGMAVGQSHTVSGSFASVSGGQDNTASGFASSVTGGQGNRASGFTTSVNGGRFNVANGFGASIGGGESNVASSQSATVSGGQFHNANGPLDWRGGGLFQDF